MMQRLMLKLRKTIWIYPVISCILSLILAGIIIMIDTRYIFNAEEILPDIFFTSTDLAKTILGTIAGSLLTMTTFTFSTTMVVLTMYSSQFSPRTVENFLTSKTTMRVLGVFMGGFVYSIFSVLFMRNAISEFMVLSATVAVLYSIVCLFYFSIFINHVGTFIQAGNLINRLYSETHDKIIEYKERIQKRGITDRPETGYYEAQYDLLSTDTGYIQIVDYDDIYETAKDIDAVIVLDKIMGQFVTKNTVIFSVYYKNNIQLDDIKKRLMNSVVVGPDKNELQDFNFSLQKIIEIALRAISPGINDPNTANHCIRIIGVLLSQIADTDSGYITYRDEDSKSAAIFEAIDFEKELYFTYYQMVHYGASDVSVMLAILKSLRYIAENSTQKNKETVKKMGDYVMDHLDERLRSGFDYHMLLKEKEEVDRY